MTGRNDRLAWAVAVGLLASVALVGGLIVEGWREGDRPSPGPTTQFFVVTLA